MQTDQETIIRIYGTAVWSLWRTSTGYVARLPGQPHAVESSTYADLLADVSFEMQELLLSLYELRELRAWVELRGWRLEGPEDAPRPRIDLPFRFQRCDV